MKRTAIQLDMTAFYSADEALHALRAGRSTAFDSPEFQINLSYLALIVSSACLFDRITVGVPAVLDPDFSADQFAPEASQLSEILRQVGIVEVLSLNAQQKEDATNDLASLRTDYCMSTVDFIANLTPLASASFGRWARGQLDSPVIQRHTYVEEKASEVHRVWTTALADETVARIAQLGSLGNAASWSDDILKYVVNNLLRGFIYEIAGAQMDTFYLPYFIREGLLSHAKDDRPRAKAAMAFCSLVLPEDELTRVFAQSRPDSGDIAFGKAAILRDMQVRGDYRPERIADMILEERQKRGNKELRKQLRAADATGKADQVTTTWLQVLKRDHAVWEGKELPLLIDVIPKGASLIPGVDADKVSALIDTLAPGLHSNSQFWTLLRQPVYARRHMRYLWKRFC